MVAAVRAFAPVQTITEVDGIAVVLTTVEILDDVTSLGFYCPQNARTRTLDDEFERDLQAFVERHHQGDESARPPGSPLHTLVFGDGSTNSITVDDGFGTAFSRLTSQVGGTGTEWIMHVVFRGVPDASASFLTVTMTPAGQPADGVRVDLAHR